MVNDDVLIKSVRARGHSSDWPDVVNGLKERLDEMKLGFPGIRNDHLSLIQYSQVKPGDLFIYDIYLENHLGRGDEAPMMLKLLDNGNEVKIEGIGCGADLTRDPERLLFRWGDIKPLPPLKPTDLVYRVDVRPTLNSGPAYYYFFKAYRDHRL